MSTVFREEAPTTEGKVPEPLDNTHIESDAKEFKPVESDEDVLEALGVEDDIKVLPSEDKENLSQMRSYVQKIAEDRGLPQTVSGFKKALEEVKSDLGLDEEADPQVVISRIGKLVESWRELAFIKDFTERRKVLFRLMTAKDNRESNKIILEEMGRRRIWQ